MEEQVTWGQVLHKRITSYASRNPKNTQLWETNVPYPFMGIASSRNLPSTASQIHGCDGRLAARVIVVGSL
jgi:hypothetical protein